MSRKPPAARMRQIRRNSRLTGWVAVSLDPQNVEDVLPRFMAETPEPIVEAVAISTAIEDFEPESGPPEEAEKSIEELLKIFEDAEESKKVEKVEESEEPDESEDESEEEEESEESEESKEPEESEDEISEPVPAYSNKLKKEELQALAQKYGVDDSGSKKDIVKALDLHFGL